jgi:hypothetical protein
VGVNGLLEHAIPAGHLTLQLDRRDGGRCPQGGGDAGQ